MVKDQKRWRLLRDFKKGKFCFLIGVDNWSIELQKSEFNSLYLLLLKINEQLLAIKNELMDEGIDPAAAAKQALAEFPVTVGGKSIGSGGVAPQVIPVPGKPKIIYVPEVPKKSAKNRNAVIEPFSKVAREVVS